MCSSPEIMTATAQATIPMPVPNLSSFWTNLKEALKIKLMAAGPIPKSQIGGLEGSIKLYRNIPERVRTVNPGKHQKMRASTPEIAPPWVEAVEITSWVELGPGSPWPRANNSVKTSSSIKLLTLTRWSLRMATCAVGPPKAMKPRYQKSERVSLIRVTRGCGAAVAPSSFFVAEPYPASDDTRGSLSVAVMVFVRATEDESVIPSID
mmetsp:Transcript_18430/g.42326  ORF Transcript_18430/g.42326 Transcript_18430/m.42326 type:complete len:208 (-) Transcript_18430:114-737(-)